MSPSHPADRATAPPSPLNSELLRSWTMPTDPKAGKLDRGTVLVIGGSTRTAGAVVLAGLAALRVGAGRLQIATVESVSPSLATAIPEALVEGLPHVPSGAIDATDLGERLHERLSAAQAVLIGPGFEDLGSSRAAVMDVIPHIDPRAVVVVDALGLLAMSQLPADTTAPLRGRLALTPNQPEATDLVPMTAFHADPWEVVTSAAERYGAVVTMEGHVAAADGRRWLNDERVSGLGMGGSGDVLAGLVAGGAAQHADVAWATCRATYLHLAAGKAAAARIGPIGYLARELLEPIPRILCDITTIVGS
jgi:ADP-dependent NAD(P)H-hydrate dehydratase